jgi:hypothetical protein
MLVVTVVVTVILIIAMAPLLTCKSDLTLVAAQTNLGRTIVVV